MIQLANEIASRIHRHPYWLPSLIFSLAVVSSLCFSVLVYPLVSEAWTAGPDPDRYGELARSLYTGHGLSYAARDAYVPAFNRGPLYPAVVAFIYLACGGESIGAVQVAQAFLHGSTGVLLLLLGSRIVSRRAALTAQLLHALHPILIWYTARVWVETLHTSLLTATVLALVILMERTTVARAVLLGALLAGTVLTKSTALLLPVPLLLFSLVRGSRELTRGLLASTLLAAVLIAPWTLRNFSLSGRVVPVHTSLGQNLVHGEIIAEQSNPLPLAHRALWLLGEARTDSMLATQNLTVQSPGGDSYLIRAIAVHWILDPLAFGRHAAINALTFWYLAETPVKSLIGLAIQLPLILLLARALPRFFRQRSTADPVWVVILYFWAVHAVIFGWLRFSVPVLPLIILLAVQGLFSSRSRTGTPWAG